MRRRRPWTHSRESRPSQVSIDPGRASGQDPVAVDYPQLRSRAEPTRLGDQEIHVAHVDDLIPMKVRAGRPIDLQDIAAITGHEVRDVQRLDRRA